MTAAQARLAFRALVNESDTTVLPDSTSGSTYQAVDQYIQAGLEELNRHVPFYVKDSTSWATLVNGTQEYAAPTDLQNVIWLEHNGVRLDKSSMDEWHIREIDWRSATAGTPTEYAHYGAKIIFYVKPNAAAVTADSTPDMRYFAAPDFPTSIFTSLHDGDHRVPIFYAAALFFDADVTRYDPRRADAFYKRFYDSVAGMKERYRDRGVGK